MAKTIVTIFLFCGWCCLFTTLSCEAPRRNPLDPKNPDYGYVLLSGQVQTVSVPHQPISGVQVVWSADRRIAVSDANGRFQFADISPQNGFLYFRSEYCRLDSAEIKWSNEKSLDILRYLNRLPRLEKMVVASTVLHDYPDQHREEMTMEAQIEAPDLDIDSVLVDYPLLSWHRKLSYTISNTTFQAQGTFKPADFKIKSLHTLVGQEFKLSVHSRSGHRDWIGQGFLRRVIYDEVQLLQPINIKVIGSRPRLQWKKLLPGFPFTYDVEIYAGGSTLKVWEKTRLAAEVIDCEVDSDLAGGDYYWVIWCVDEFNNRSRSNEKQFTVQ